MALVRFLILTLVSFLVLAPAGNTQPSPTQNARILSGTVRDTAGRPVTGASVWVVCGYIARQTTRVIKQTTTDSSGIFHFSGLPLGASYDGMRLPMVLVARAGDGPFAIHSITLNTYSALVPNMVLPEAGATLEARVLGPGGEPQAGIPVAVSPKTAATILPLIGRIEPDSRAAAKSLQRLLYPRAVTDSQGMVRFTHLMPDHYELTAVRMDPEEALNPELLDRLNDPLNWRRFIGYGGGKMENAVALSLPVTRGETNRFTARLQKPGDPLRLRFLLPDGQTLRHSSIGFLLTAAAWGQNSSYTGVSTGGNFTGEEFHFRPGMGLWRLATGLKTEPPHESTQKDPRLFGETTLAFSPYRERHDVVEIQTRLTSGEQGEKASVVAIRPGSVNRHDSTPRPDYVRSEKREEERRDFAESLTGSVLLPDGKTPAFGARVIVYDPARPYGFAGVYWTGATGVFNHTQILWLNYASPYVYLHRNRPLSDGPETRTAIAFLPGSHGATLMPLPEGNRLPPLRITLPPQISARGRVTVGGKHFGPSCPGIVRVIAAYQDGGPLNDLLSVETTAESDGSFILTGLTPGKYHIQATLDNIWLSPTQTITVSAEKTSILLALDIPEPGQPIVVELGKGYAGARVSLETPLPEGPFSEQYRAAYYVADGAGRLRLEGLPAGRHRLRLPDKRVITAAILPYPAHP